MILIVDDRPENILPLKKILELNEFETDTADSGENALRKILKNNYSLIIMDVQMPDMDGFEVAEAIKGFNKAKDTPIIFLSAVSKDKRFISQGYASGGVDYITKPVDPDILLLKVNTFHTIYKQKQELNSIQEILREEIEIRKRAETELQKRMKELHSVLELLPLITFTIAENGKIEFVNKYWYNYAKDLNAFPQAHPADEAEYENWKKHFSSGEKFSCELRIKNLQSNHFKYFSLLITPVVFNQTILRWVGTFTDINRQKMEHEILEQKVTSRTAELLNKNEELEAINQELKHFTWVVSHDLKEPLRKIQLFNSQIKEKYLGNNEAAIALIDRTINSSNHLSGLINDLLEYSKLSIHNPFEPTNFNKIIENITHDFDELMKLKKTDIIISKLPIIEAIPAEIRQVFQNLFSNALKFAQTNIPLTLRINTELIQTKEINGKADPNGKFCRIIFSDNGIGFDLKYLDKVFVIFQRLNQTEEYEGTGVGLAIVKKIIDKHHGLISATSKLNDGANFIIVLPLTQTRITETNINLTNA